MQKPHTKRPAKASPIALDVAAPGHAQKKAKCPHCGQKRYVRYWDSNKREYLPDEFGKCDREENCGYFKAPWEWLKANRPNNMEPKRYQPQAKTQSLFTEPKQVDRQLVARTLQAYEFNNLVHYLATVLGEALTAELCIQYFLGTGKDGATIYWYIDQFQRVRSGRRIVYKLDGHRDKAAEMKQLFMVHEGYEMCLFGEHLLYKAPKDMPVAIVESEKTAAIASVYLPFLGGRRVLWMAASGVYGLTPEKCTVLSGREVILVPDFSFHARAIWGMVQMRKGPNERGQVVIREDGVLQEDYVSKADMLRALHCSVRFFDAAPHLTDASDLADLLLQSPPPQRPPDPPDYSRLVLPGGEKAAAAHTAQAKQLEKAPAIQIHTKHPSGFRIAYNAEKRPQATAANEQEQVIVDKFFNNSSIQALAASFECVTGEIVYDDSTPWRTSADWDQLLRKRKLKEI